VAPALAQRVGHAGQARIEELRLLDANEIHVALAGERQDPDRLGLGDLYRGVARLAAALGVVTGRPVIHVRADEQDPPLRDLRAAEEAQQLVGLAGRHAAGDDVEPGIGTVEHGTNLPARGRSREWPPRREAPGALTEGVAMRRDGHASHPG